MLLLLVFLHPCSFPAPAPSLCPTLSPIPARWLLVLCYHKTTATAHCDLCFCSFKYSFSHSCFCSFSSSCFSPNFDAALNRFLATTLSLSPAAVTALFPAAASHRRAPAPRGVLPYMRYIGMCRPKGYGF